FHQRKFLFAWFAPRSPEVDEYCLPFIVRQLMLFPVHIRQFKIRCRISHLEHFPVLLGGIVVECKPDCPGENQQDGGSHEKTVLLLCRQATFLPFFSSIPSVRSESCESARELRQVCDDIRHHIKIQHDAHEDHQAPANRHELGTPFFQEGHLLDEERHQEERNRKAQNIKQHIQEPSARIGDAHRHDRS